jgi:prepilin-type N-terminal cleavage/methylation domain-containing protein
MSRRNLTIRPWRHPRAPGFTLIELLVVMAILAVLTAISLPALTAARRAGRQIHCQSRLKDIAVAYTLYCSNNDGRFYGDGSNVRNPCFTFGGWRGKGSLIRHRPVNKYVGLREDDAGERETRKYFRCPADNYPDSNELSFGSYYAENGNSYQANLLLVDLYKLPANVATAWGTINGQIRTPGFATYDTAFQPSRLLWIGDYLWYVQWDPRSSVCTRSHDRRHHYCMAFLDGHIEFVEIRRGLYDVDGSYRIQPHKAADETVRGLQRQQPCSCEKK